MIPPGAIACSFMFASAPAAAVTSLASVLKMILNGRVNAEK